MQFWHTNFHKFPLPWEGGIPYHPGEKSWLRHLVAQSEAEPGGGGGDTVQSAASLETKIGSIFPDTQ